MDKLVLKLQNEFVIERLILYARYYLMFFSKLLLASPWLLVYNSSKFIHLRLQRLNLMTLILYNLLQLRKPIFSINHLVVKIVCIAFEDQVYYA